MEGRPIRIEMTDEAARFAAQGTNEPPPAPRPAAGRLTVVERVAHQAGDDHLSETPFSFECELETDERKVEKLMTLGFEWAAVPRFFGDCPAMLHIAAKGGAVHVAINKPGAVIVIPPGQSARFRPCAPGDVFVLSPDAPAKCVVTVFPP